MQRQRKSEFRTLALQNNIGALEGFMKREELEDQMSALAVEKGAVLEMLRQCRPWAKLTRPVLRGRVSITLSLCSIAERISAADWHAAGLKT